MIALYYEEVIGKVAENKFVPYEEVLLELDAVYHSVNARQDTELLMYNKDSGVYTYEKEIVSYFNASIVFSWLRSTKGTEQRNNRGWKDNIGTCHF